MNDKAFVDTNVLVYAHDVDAGPKQAIAASLLRDLWNAGLGVLSMQVLQEFYVNVTKKIAAPLSKDMARHVVNTYAAWCIETTPTEIAAAFRIEDESRLGFWDSLIVAAAAKAGAVRILSEDLNPQQMIAGVRVENPFTSD